MNDGKRACRRELNLLGGDCVEVVRGLPAWVDDRRGLRRMVLIVIFLHSIAPLPTAF